MYFLMVPGSFLCLTVYDFDLLAGLMAGAIRIFHLFLSYLSSLFDFAGIAC